jgi:plastocyanin
MSIIQNPVSLRRLALVASVTIGTIGFAACSSGDDDDDAATDTTTADQSDQPDYGDDTGTTAAPADGGGDATGAAVAYTVDAIQYSDVTAPAGGTIDITNSSGAPHTFTADDGGFDVSYEAETTATVDVPAEAGDYTFHCNIHPSMQATLTVQ